MSKLKTIRAICAAALAAATALAAASCNSSGGESDPGGQTGSGLDKTFTMAMVADPGALDPALGVSSSLNQFSSFAYDTLVNLARSGDVLSGLATAWEQEADKVIFTIKEGVTCSDGSTFTAQTAAGNINFVADPENASPLLGVTVPVGATAEAEGSTLTLNLASPSPFVLSSLTDLYMVCDAGLADRSTLVSATNGTGPYVLEDLVPNDHYTYKVRPEYAWGPDGAATAGSDMPGTVVVRVIENETTAANLLTSKEINAAVIRGADADRMEAAGLASQVTLAVAGEQWYNHGEGHLTADPAVRDALAQAVDLTELGQVLTSGKGSPPTLFTILDPAPCTGSVVAENLPVHSVESAGAVLDAAGWVVGADGIRAKDGTALKLSFVYNSGLGAPGSAAAELAVAAWAAVGIQVEPQQISDDQLLPVLFGTGEWDVAWVTLHLVSPDQLVPFVSGAGLAEGGQNFSEIDNAAYDALAAEAMGEMGAAGCPAWLEGQAELTKANDVTLFVNNATKMYLQGAEMSDFTTHLPTSIKMTD
ncbi:MAG: ABC transporter substrate-binding protein [Bifidobacteriaceae bacterium]|jgi:peptide/nickel transport system substrate-binding protein|nr:ABC transporter substrate-binding protein [Bifidobacteriaceae bacterium]